jgi:hypothetical protein
MTRTRPSWGFRLKWYAILLVRLLLTHPLRWDGERSRWKDDRDRAAMPPPWD